MNAEPTKQLGHSICQLIAPRVGQTVSLKKGTILHTFNPSDGKGPASDRLDEDIQYTNVGTQHAYVVDEEATFNFLEDNDIVQPWGDRLFRPARPDETGQVLTGWDFRAPNVRPGGWTYDQIQPGQCLWVEVDRRPTAEPVESSEFTRAQELMIARVAEVVNTDTDPEFIKRSLRERLARERRVTDAMREVLSETQDPA
jgi:hypothetical protein